MSKKFLKLIWILTGAVTWLVIFIKTFYEWTHGKQPDNFTVMIILLLAILMQGMFSKQQ